MVPRILIVDDNPGITSILTMIFEMEGAIVLTAASGEECLAMIAREKPDIVILDIVMSPMDGWTVLERIRSDRENDAMKILVVTAKPPTAQEAEKYASLVDGYIMKPFDLPALKKTVADLLSDSKKVEKIAKRSPEEGGARAFLEEYCRLSRIVRAQAAFSALLAPKGRAREEVPTPEALRLMELTKIIRQVTGINGSVE